LNLVGYELHKLGGRTCKNGIAQVGDAGLDLGIGKTCVDFLVELVNDLGRNIRWRDSKPTVQKRKAMATAAARAKEVLSFGPFKLHVYERLLTKDGTPLELGSRALEILIVLTSTPNEVVSKNEVMSRVWPDVIVEEANLRTQMAILRKALGDGRDGARYITTIPGRGYC